MYPARKDMIAIMSALTTFAYVTHWLLHHSFAQEPHHYITALVLVGWLSALPLVAFSHHERSKHHGLG